MRLDLDIPRTRGRAPKQVVATVVRELEVCDLELLSQEKGSSAPALKRLGHRHHYLAKLLASGIKPGEASAMTTYSASRISILQSDPAFKELVEFYRADIERQFRGMHERLSGLAQDAADELQNRLEDSPEDLSIGQLMEITKLGADRTGHGPQTSNTNLNVNVDLAGKLKAARERVAHRNTRVIEIGPPDEYVDNQTEE